MGAVAFFFERIGATALLQHHKEQNMGWLEWIGESVNPGPMGSLKTGNGRAHRTKGAVLVRLCLSLVITGGLFYLLFFHLIPFNLKHCAAFSGLFLLYLVAGYFIRPEPDTSNLGWLGGLMDNPFRYSDDVNRCFLWLKLFFFPGLFLSESFLDGLRLFLQRKVTCSRKDLN